MKKIYFAIVPAFFIILTGCANKNMTHSPVEPLIIPQAPEFELIANTHNWVNHEYRKYLSSKGFKAFAYMNGENMLATGWSDDEKNKDNAIIEAIRLCRHYGNSEAPCSIVDNQPPTH